MKFDLYLVAHGKTQDSLTLITKGATRGECAKLRAAQRASSGETRSVVMYDEHGGFVNAIKLKAT